MRASRLALTTTLSVSALLCGVVALPASAAAPTTTPTTVISGLVGPTHIALHSGQVFIADSFAGQILKADPATGAKKTLATKIGVNSVSIGANGNIYAVGAGGTIKTPGLVRLVGGKPVLVADLLAYEKAHNPDGQPQQTGPHADALSNPYDVLAQPNRVLVADAAGNDILSVSLTGTVSTLAVLPVSKVGSCAHATNNGVKNGGCDPVPTGLAVGPDGYLYVSGLGGEVAGHIWKIDQSSGQIVAEYDGLPPLTGIAVGARGTIYASSLFVNKVYSLSPAGVVNGSASVTGPTGIQVLGGQLYAASVTIPKKGAPSGVIVRLPESAF